MEGRTGREDNAAEGSEECLVSCKRHLLISFLGGGIDATLKESTDRFGNAMVLDQTS